MVSLSPAEVYRLARAAGLPGDAAVIATAIAWAESGLRPDAIGDEDLQDEKWGPSCGLWQIRSLRAHSGTGLERDRMRLLDPAFNARAMVTISGGISWSPWSVYKNGRYAQHLDAVRAAVKETTTMHDWHPRAQRVTPADGRGGLSFDGVPFKVVLHTTETDAYSPSRASYYGNPYWPHATIVPGTIYQHLPISAGGYALYSDGSVSTNHANAVQCEIVWRAANGDWPDDLLATVADWVTWVQAQTGVPTIIAEMFREGVSVASVDSPIRFGDQEWLDFSGICGHSNVPGGNDHWDPGRLPVDRLRALLGGAAPTPQPQPKEEDDDTMRLIGVTNDRGIFLVSAGLEATGKAKGKATARHIGTPAEVDSLVAAGVVPGYNKQPDLPEDIFDRTFVVVG